MVDEKSEVKSEKGVSILVLALCCVVSMLLGLAGGVVSGPTLKSTLGMEEELATANVGDSGSGAMDEYTEDPSSLFAPMPGVFSLIKSGFTLMLGNLVAIKYQGRTRYLQLSAQLVGHDEDFMGKVETDVPAIRNGLSIFFTQQDFSAVSTLEGREALRLATLVEINKIIGATAELRVADVYFTDYITQ